jgi:PAS domain S-box-containing protein
MVKVDTSDIKDKALSPSSLDRKYQYLFDHMVEGFALCEIICDEKNIPCDYRILEVNKAYEKQTGIEANAIVGKTVLEFYPDIEKYWIKMYGDIVLTKESRTFINYNHNTGRYYDTSAFPYENGQFALLFKDITEQKQLEQENNDANEEKQKRADELILANEEKQKRADELILANEEKQKRADELILANIELAFQNKEKDKRADELILANVEKEHLLQKLKRAASVFSSAHESIIITDSTATITEVNDAFSYITGYSPDDVLGKNPRILQSGRQSP